MLGDVSEGGFPWHVHGGQKLPSPTILDVRGVGRGPGTEHCHFSGKTLNRFKRKHAAIGDFVGEWNVGNCFNLSD
ncbi:hypothetical protein DW095_14635, partial [Bacteroides sp. AM07-16]